ncbi:MAG: peptidoglycan DD-metalloendopeptidase family protein [candidate division Zixibacteria bacterium]|nr:peptidoglycan DD-metalloendopeptidase family protein [candidate division Zixibacteria bacterium]
MIRTVLYTVVLVSCLTGGLLGSGWPVQPDSSVHKVSALFGTYLENPGNPPFMHSGIDIEVPFGTPVYAIKSGYVKTVMTRPPGEMGYSMWRVFIGDSAGTIPCEAIMYAHLVESSIPYFVPDQWVEEGELIGLVVNWSNPDIIIHLHMSIVRYQGTWQDWADGWDYWVYSGNPLDMIDIIDDSDLPYFDNALGDQLFAFCDNNGSTYFSEEGTISGEVDIVCAAYDAYHSYHWKNIPYMIEYKIEGDSSIPWTVSTYFTEPTGTYTEMSDYVSVIYQDDAVCNTSFGSEQFFYFNLTNTNSDTVVEQSDTNFCWQTTYFHDGNYTVFARATDKGGNSIVDSMIVTLDNHLELSGVVSFGDGNPYDVSAYISVEPDGAYDTTDIDGNFLLSNVGGGTQTIIFSRAGYETVDTVLMMIQNRNLNVTMNPASYACGNIDNETGSGGPVDIADLTYLVNYLFIAGSEPPIQAAANVDGIIGSGGPIDIADLTYFVAYLFLGGPESVCDGR